MNGPNGLPKELSCCRRAGNGPALLHNIKNIFMPIRMSSAMVLGFHLGGTSGRKLCFTAFLSLSAYKDGSMTLGVLG